MKGLLVYWKFYALLSVMISSILIGVYFYGRHNGVVSQEQKVSKANAQRDDYKSKNAALISKINDVNIEAKKAKEEADKARKREQEASVRLDAYKDTMKEQEEKFSQRVTNASKKPECAVLKERLCPSVLGY